MLTSIKSKITRSINGCKNDPAVEREINRAAIAGDKVELINCAGKDCICRIELLRQRMHELQLQYKTAQPNMREQLWQQISNVKLELLNDYGTH